MSMRLHTSNPEDAVEAAFFRVQLTSMVDVPILNPALQVQAIDFQRWQGHWLGIVITPWCMSMTLVPGSIEGWISVGVNKRRFIKFPSGDFAFLGGCEEELGEYQSCSLFSPMNKFATQSDAVQTARAALIGLLTSPQTMATADTASAQAGVSGNHSKALSRRGFFALRKP